MSTVSSLTPDNLPLLGPFLRSLIRSLEGQTGQVDWVLFFKIKLMLYC